MFSANPTAMYVGSPTNNATGKFKLTLRSLCHKGHHEQYGDNWGGGIPVSFLKLMAPIIAMLVAQTVVLSFLSAQVLLAFKSAIVVLIHKGKGKPTSSPSCYRPVASYPSLVKSAREACASVTDTVPGKQTTSLSVWISDRLQCINNDGQQPMEPGPKPHLLVESKELLCLTSWLHLSQLTMVSYVKS